MTQRDGSEAYYDSVTPNMPNSMSYIYEPSKINSLEKSISVARLSTYTQEIQGGDRELALKLYLWNTEISSSFHFPLQMAEIALRNSLHCQLEAKFGVDWPSSPRVPFDQREVDSFAAARSKIQRGSKTVTTSRLVANLSFGFWVGLLRGPYHTSLWTPVISRAFPRKIRNRKNIQNRYINIKELRNRIAHHEPIFNYLLELKLNEALEAISWHGRETRNWVEQHSTVLEVLQKKP